MGQLDRTHSNSGRWFYITLFDVHVTLITIHY